MINKIRRLLRRLHCAITENHKREHHAENTYYLDGMEIFETQFICTKCLKFLYKQEITFTEAKIKENVNTRIPVPDTKQIKDDFVEAEKAEGRH